MPKVLYVVCGGARTFLKCFDSLYTNVVQHLFKNADNRFLFYLKTTDPGPKGQQGWNFSYHDVSHLDIENKLAPYQHMIFEKRIIYGNEISDGNLLKQVKDRSKYKGFLGEDAKLVRGLHCHFNIEQCGKMIEDLGQDFDYYVYVRPDILFTQKARTFEVVDRVLLAKGPLVVVSDHFAIIPRAWFNHFFIDRMKFIRTNTTITFNIIEELYMHTIRPYREEVVCHYDILRS